jgi:hypothetical protein
LKRESKADRALSVVGDAEEALRSTVVFSAKRSHWFRALLSRMASGTGFAHWKRLPGSK